MAIPIVYSHEQIIKDPSLEIGAFKARNVYEMVSRDTNLCITDFPKASFEELGRVHSYEFVENLLTGKIPNGFRTTSASHIQSILKVNGNLLKAVQLVGNTPDKSEAAFSITSGFHHAGFDFCHGYCTFNALMLAAVQYHDRTGKRVLILDGDAHLGDGCIDILKRIPNLTSFIDYSFVGFRGFGYSIKKDRILYRVMTGHYGLVLYQPGADSFINDNLGAGSFTKEQFIRRDEEVFQSCRDSKTNIVWNLAGGYGAPGFTTTLQIHYSTWQTANRVFHARNAENSQG